MAMLAICTFVIATDTDTGSDATVKSGTSGTVYLTIGTDTYSQTFTQSEWSDLYFWDWSSGQNVPGMTISSFHTQTVTLSVNPTSVGTYTVNLNTLVEGSTPYEVGAYSWSITFVITAPATAYNYSVTYNTNGYGGNALPQTATSTATSYSFSSHGQPGYVTGMTFLGWSTDASATTGTYTAGSTITVYSSNPSITLYAIYGAVSHTYTLTYDANGGTGAPATQTATSTNYEYTFTLSGTIPARDGYTFLGWATTSTGLVTGTTVSSMLTTTCTFYETIAVNKTIYAIWQETVLTTVSFNANNGSGAISDQAVLSGNSIYLPYEGINRTGYVLTGWTEGVNGTFHDICDEYVVLSDITFYAAWQTVSAYLDPNAPSSCDVATEYTYTPDLSTDSWIMVYEVFNSYTFTINEKPSWMTITKTTTSVTFSGTPSATGVYTVSICMLNSGGEVLSHSTVEWTISVIDPSTSGEYIVTYSAGLGEGSHASSVGALGTAVTLASDGFARDGYTLAAWSTSIDGTTVYYSLGSIYTITEAKTFTAVYVADTGVIVFDANGGIVTDTSSAYMAYAVQTDSQVTMPSSGLTKTGYTFAGWYLSSLSNAIFAPGYIYTISSTSATIVVLAYWIDNNATKYTVTYNFNSGVGSLSQVVTSGKNVILPTAGFTYTGHALKSWNSSANGTGMSYVLGGTCLITATKTLYAIWEESESGSDSYVITFDLNGGSGAVQSQTIASGGTATEPSNPSRTYYIFSYWQLSGSTGEYDFSAEVTESITLKAIWINLFSTATSGQKVTLTLVSDYNSYQTTINWGDGSDNTVGSSGPYTHEYDAGSYGTITVTVNGIENSTHVTYTSVAPYSVSETTGGSNTDDDGDNGNDNSSLMSFVSEYWILILVCIVALLVVARFVI